MAVIPTIQLVLNDFPRALYRSCYCQLVGLAVVSDGLDASRGAEVVRWPALSWSWFDAGHEGAARPREDWPSSSKIKDPGGRSTPPSSFGWETEAPVAAKLRRASPRPFSHGMLGHRNFLWPMSPTRLTQRDFRPSGSGSTPSCKYQAFLSWSKALTRFSPHLPQVHAAIGPCPKKVPSFPDPFNTPLRTLSPAPAP